MEKKPFIINKAQQPVSENLTSEILKTSDSLSFHSSLEGYKPSPLHELKGLARHVQVGKIYMKDESHRFGLNAFKGLGASYAIYKILQKNPEIGTFCTATDGNHGRAVAWAAKIFGKQARIFVPKDTTAARIQAIRNEGAIVEQLKENYDETCAYAAEKSKEGGWELVQDTSWEGYEEIPAQIMAGYLTQFREMEESIHGLPIPEVDVVFLQAGVGSWPASAAWYYQSRYGKNRPKIVLVEPSESSGILESFRKGKRSKPVGNYSTIMAGLNCGIPSLNAWEILKNAVDVAMEMDDAHAKKAMKRLHDPLGDDLKIISGESGVAGFAGFLALLKDSQYREVKEYLKIGKSSRLLFYSTEGATDPDNYQRVIQEEC